MKDYFEEVAENWDRMRSEYFDERVREKVIAEAGITSSMRVVDIGIGTGFMAIGLARIAKSVVGIDQSTKMLQVASQNLLRLGINNVELRKGCVEKIPLEDESMDAVFGNMILHHIQNPPRAIKEMGRILKKGGRLVITDLDKHDNEWMKEKMADVWLGFDRRQVDKWLREARFNDVIVKCTGCDCCGESSNGEKVKVSIFLALGVK